MSGNWEDVRGSIREFFAAAAEKTDEFIKIGKRKLSIAEIKRNITGQYAELGGRVYHLIRQGETASIREDAEVEALVSSIQRLEDQLKAKEMEIEEIRAAAGQTAAGPSAGGEESSGESRTETKE